VYLLFVESLPIYYPLFHSGRVSTLVLFTCVGLAGLTLNGGFLLFLYLQECVFLQSGLLFLHHLRLLP